MREGAYVPADNQQLRPGSVKMNLTARQWSNLFGDNMLRAAEP